MVELLVEVLNKMLLLFDKKLVTMASKKFNYVKELMRLSVSVSNSLWVLIKPRMERNGMEPIGARADFKITIFPFLYHYLFYSIYCIQ